MIQGSDGQSKETAIVLATKTPAVIKQEYSIYHDISAYWKHMYGGK